jgi:hypothetical protein
VPRAYTDAYYELSRDVASSLVDTLDGTGVDVLQTSIVDIATLSTNSRAAEVASIVSSSAADRVFLVLDTDRIPRRELRETEDLKGAMRLIRYLEQSGMRVLVAFSSSDLILWKAAGASDCATGKHWNLRRFSVSRWEPETEGTGQVSYWFEESLMAYLRHSDLDRVRAVGLLSPPSERNPYCTQIVNQMGAAPDSPWLALSWRQFLWWFADFETRCRIGGMDPDGLLAEAEDNWDRLEDHRVLMEERANNGEWLRAWRRAIREAFVPG